MKPEGTHAGCCNTETPNHPAIVHIHMCVCTCVYVYVHVDKKYCVGCVFVQLYYPQWFSVYDWDVFPTQGQIIKSPSELRWVTHPSWWEVGGCGWGGGGGLLRAQTRSYRGGGVMIRGGGNVLSWTRIIARFNCPNDKWYLVSSTLYVLNLESPTITNLVNNAHNTMCSFPFFHSFLVKHYVFELKKKKKKDP